MPPRKAFTLIELLVVIAIIAILAVVVVLTLNPAQLLAQSRDANRVSDLATLNSAIGLYQTDVPGGSMGTSSVIFTSLPDASSTCGTWGLLALPASDTYACSPSSEYRLTNGSGWIPIDFSSISSGDPFGSLPVDPTNQSSTGLYYTYATNGSQYELTASMESEKYGTTYASITGDPGFLTKGTNLTLNPVNYNLSNPLNAGLVAEWSLDEGAGTIAYDNSGHGNTGTWYGTQAGTSGYYTAGHTQPWAGYFDGSTDYLPVGNATGILNVTSTFTFSAWINIHAYPPSGGISEIFDKGWNGSVTQYELALNNDQGGCGTNPGALQIDIYEGFVCTKAAYPYSNLALNTWYFVAGTFNGSEYALYVDGVQVASTTSDLGPPASGEMPVIGGYQSSGNYGADFSGLIQRVRVYTRALSLAELADLYNGGR